jgi:hypothetical protein
MTVKELMTKLSKCDPNKDVVLEFLDRDGFPIKTSLDDKNFFSDFGMLNEIDNEGEEKFKSVVLLCCDENLEVGFGS